MNNYIFYGVIIIILIIFYYSTQTNLIKTRATNNKIYYTQKKDALIAAEKLVKIDKFIQKLRVHLLEDHPLHELIQKKMKHNIIIKELPKNSKHVAYIINKTKLYVCLRNKNGTFIDQYNRIYFVVMHELAHMITKTTGHTDEYWNNYKLIIETAVKHKLYTYKNYFDSPVEYCGKDINSTPYIKGGFLENNKIEISTIIGIILLVFIIYLTYQYFYNNNSNYDNSDYDNVEIVHKDDVVFGQDYKIGPFGEILKKRSDGAYIVDKKYANNSYSCDDNFILPDVSTDYKFDINKYEKIRTRRIQ